MELNMAFPPAFPAEYAPRPWTRAGSLLPWLTALLTLLTMAYAAAKPDEDSSPTINAASNQMPQIIAALYQGPGTGGKGPPSLLKQLNARSEISLTPISPEEINAGVLTNFDVVIFAGGSASKQSAALSEAGCAQVQQFVANGGGYIGICAGAYLATCNSAQRLHLINADTLSPKWQRGRAVLKMEITQPGAEIFGGEKTNLEVLYHNGPVVGPAADTNLPPYETLAFFRIHHAPQFRRRSRP